MFIIKFRQVCANHDGYSNIPGNLFSKTPKLQYSWFLI
ncbi:hypothetical protein D1BOALGB6SA_5657 [Olavius sp. associated proteobacterium Delta 1]|nr:hypothetical protein D1BOALGB6SA_5657 [Olavius sp. associated proteobacterium Delta 1]